MTEAKETFEEWAIVELMGHRQLAGKVREVFIAGAGFIRIDTPETADRPAKTHFHPPSAFYGIHPCTEAVAKQATARMYVTDPVARFSLPELPAPVDDVEDADIEEPYDGGLDF